MVIAIASIGGEISPHFGHSDGCMIYSLANQELTVNEFVNNPLARIKQGLFRQNHGKDNCSCRFFAEFLLHEIQFDVLVTGHIGDAASQLLSRRGVEVIANTKGNISDYLREYISKKGLTCPAFALS
ncbi:NifB/NifX family molybdenum-iron cluster-binding protein [Desulfosporosinus youngiae]|uniref:Dinitrogenase iron-molybdenum cofactor biosynthesis domain-containing protein n=1 Tax=Desulfosporosinus youngiae DSM 17734 TaxID=768710 RepID=H5XV32_9FIRM|nr:NifB/NifX family molybdenum-iron cluster-binding protein [Desulfosporosinus youngiae]EHQ89630.1 hypothetical protein DesyoDRAFT_2564 [Desulfosporosinus youngiae DSM 17734]